MWTDIQIIEYLEDELRMSNSSEVFEFFKDKIRDASENKQIISIEFIPMKYNDKDELLFDSNTEIYIDIEDNSDYSDCINWRSLIPAHKRTNDTIICEIGLYLAQSEFIKLIQSTKSSGIEDLLSKKIYNFDSYDIKDTDSLIKYMNLSNIHIKKNEELEKAIDTQKMLYKTYKLLSQITNGDDYDFVLPIKLLEEFIKIPII